MKNKEKVMKQISSIILLLFSLWAIVGCSSDFIEPTKSGICFEKSTYKVALGSLPYAITDSTVSVLVETIGELQSEERFYKLQIIDTATTVIANLHYNQFDLNRKIKSNATHDTLKIKINRRALDDHSDYVLTLGIDESSPLQPQILERSLTKIVFNNRLDMPIWWTSVAYWLGEYDVRKYQKVIEYNGKPVTKEQFESRKYEYLRIFKRVKEYFDAHPEEGITFPDVVWEV